MQIQPYEVGENAIPCPAYNEITNLIMITSRSDGTVCDVWSPENEWWKVKTQLSLTRWAISLCVMCFSTF